MSVGSHLRVGTISCRETFGEGRIYGSDPFTLREGTVRGGWGGRGGGRGAYLGVGPFSGKELLGVGDAFRGRTNFCLGNPFQDGNGFGWDAFRKRNRWGDGDAFRDRTNFRFAASTSGRERGIEGGGGRVASLPPRPLQEARRAAKATPTAQATPSPEQATPTPPQTTPIIALATPTDEPEVRTPPPPNAPPPTP